MAFTKEDMEVFHKYFPYVCLVALAFAYIRKDAQYSDIQHEQTQFWRDAFVRTNEAYNSKPRSYDYRENSERNGSGSDSSRR